MAAVPVTITGPYSMDGDQIRIVGLLSLTGFYPSHPLPDPPQPGQPPVIWPGPGPLPGVGHPIVLPGDPGWEPPTLPPGSPPANKFDWQLHATWTEDGWTTVVIGVPNEGTLIPTPA